MASISFKMEDLRLPMPNGTNKKTEAKVQSTEDAIDLTRVRALPQEDNAIITNTSLSKILSLTSAICSNVDNVADYKAVSTVLKAMGVLVTNPVTLDESSNSRSIKEVTTLPMYSDEQLNATVRSILAKLSKDILSTKNAHSNAFQILSKDYLTVTNSKQNPQPVITDVNAVHVHDILSDDDVETLIPTAAGTTLLEVLSMAKSDINNMLIIAAGIHDSVMTTTNDISKLSTLEIDSIASTVTNGDRIETVITNDVEPIIRRVNLSLTGDDCGSFTFRPMTLSLVKNITIKFTETQPWVMSSEVMAASDISVNILEIQEHVSELLETVLPSLLITYEAICERMGEYSDLVENVITTLFESPVCDENIHQRLTTYVALDNKISELNSFASVMNAVLVKFLSYVVASRSVLVIARTQQEK